MERGEHYHHKSVFVGQSRRVVEGNHGPPCFCENLEHDELGSEEGVEVGKLVVHAVVGRGSYLRRSEKNFHGEDSQDIVDDSKKGEKLEENGENDRGSEDEILDALVD